MKKLLPAIAAFSLLPLAIFPSASQASTLKTFSGRCFLKNETYVKATERSCVVSTNSTGIYGLSHSDQAEWNVVVDGNTKAVICKKDGRGILVKPEHHPNFNDEEYRWYGTCRGLKTFGVYYILFEASDDLFMLNFPQY